MPSGHSIGTLKSDGTLNIQVQTHTINEIKSLFRDDLGVSFTRRMSVELPSGGGFALTDVASPEVLVLSRGDQTHATFYVEFDVGAQVVPEAIDCTLRIKPEVPSAGPWVRSAQRTGNNYLTASDCRRVSGYSHPLYGDGVARYRATFLVTLPQFTGETTEPFPLGCTASVPDEVGDEVSLKGVATCRGE
jgi:hypothetical protein